MVFFLFFEDNILVISLAISLQSEFHDRLDKIGLVMSVEYGDGDGSEERVGRFGYGIGDSGDVIEEQLFIEEFKLFLH